MRRIAAMSLLLAFLVPTSVRSQESEPFKVVVNAANPAAAMTRAEVSAVFLKKTTKWDHGVKALPVDQVKSSKTREAFSEAVHGKDVRAVDGYWQSQVYAGRSSPPPELATDAEVLDYVRANAGAVGYVARAATLGEGVKVLRISE